ncbi:hypothetical protein BaRGS_00001549 [Batillaria attramentaria]|uniref:Ribosomal protein S10 n=1 Tax=Batillaria attramentaria TaxID=370345 RepID=A0ABD0M750_9CAEN
MESIVRPLYRDLAEKLTSAPPRNLTRTSARKLQGSRRDEVAWRGCMKTERYFISVYLPTTSPTPAFSLEDLVVREPLNTLPFPPERRESYRQSPLYNTTTIGLRLSEKSRKGRRETREAWELVWRMVLPGTI